MILKLTREAPWAQQHPDIMGPNLSVFYFGPQRTPGHLAFGNVMPQPMANYRRQKRESSTFVVPVHELVLHLTQPATGTVRDIFTPKVVLSSSGGSPIIG
ncbi:hypothetical protein NLI96_g8955 [Meripilus lineatus]|uniref:Uncharacterized protein n=1 Tax=Meripilus lineatus TaxID=2056292 RepID=A0AAD5UY15_9APHY|nr:hypothetical protein NLI96_g8955 [Physisporinus lineatus]